MLFSWLCVLLVVSVCFLSVYSQDETKTFNTPMHEILQNQVYLGTTETSEIVVKYAGKGSDMKPMDYLTHADGVRILAGDLESFIKSGEGEVIVPVVDDDDSMFDGNRLLGFVMLKAVMPRKVTSRRGEIIFDFDEGGPAPSLKLGNIVIGAGGVKSTSDPNYSPPPHGGGSCITSRDCYNFNGTCTAGTCVCSGPFTGTYCQLNRPEYAAISKLVKKAQNQRGVSTGTSGNTASSNSNTQPGEGVAGSGGPGGKKKPGVAGNASPSSGPTYIRPPALAPTTPEPTTSFSNSNNNNNNNQRQTSSSSSSSVDDEAMAAAMSVSAAANKAALAAALEQAQAKAQALAAENAAARDAEREAAATAATAAAAAVATDEGVTPAAADEGVQIGKKKKVKRKPGAKAKPGSSNANTKQADAMSEQNSQQVTVDDLYGPGKAYPEPYAAGKMPNQQVHERYRMRFNRETFIYSIRYRNGPFGLAFDNRLADSTVVEKVIAAGQSDLSDVKVGDRLIAIDQYNLTTAPAKATQRIMNSLPWPRILVFESKNTMVDPKEIAARIQNRTYNVSVVYPPTLSHEWQLRVAEWSSLDKMHSLFHQTEVTPEGDVVPVPGAPGVCPIFKILTPKDPFGCDTKPDEFKLPDLVEIILRSQGKVPPESEQQMPMLVTMVQEALKRKNIEIIPKSLALVKRGGCTFVEKSRELQGAGADLGLVVNNENELADMPAGKENTSYTVMPMAIAREDDTALLHIAAATNEVWAIMFHTDHYPTACENLIRMADNIVDKWAHSIPHVDAATLVAAPLADNSKVRGIAEEGGRIAVSGENGWAFFDYHLAMFGPAELPPGPFKLQMAMPPFGCDPAAYTVRIKDTVVAILRGGGCSFGIKVINAQKLGAKAVMIVNTDDMKTMRLMALPDEVPQINIPCIMVSRRIQFYLEAKLRQYYVLSQHMVSMQATGVFGDYEKRNSLVLPARLQNS